jgi:hypothetical protein
VCDPSLARVLPRDPRAGEDEEDLLLRPFGVCGRRPSARVDLDAFDAHVPGADRAPEVEPRAAEVSHVPAAALDVVPVRHVLHATTIIPSVAEPPAVAEHAEEVVPGVWRWAVANANIGGAESTAHAVRADGGIVLIDPVRLAEAALEVLAPVTAICLSAQCHQRSAWRYRHELGAPVHAPEGTRPMEEEPDHRYAAGDVLPGGLRAVHTPGPEEVHFSFLRSDEPSVLFCSDLLTHYGGQRLDFVPLEYHDDPTQTRGTVEGLLELDFDVLCLDHGSPIVDDPKGAIRELLERTA